MPRLLWRHALDHRAAVTIALVAVLLVNLLVVPRVQPASASVDSGLPLASHCQGGGPGCAVQPMIPPPVGGLPHVEGPAAPVFGLRAAVALSRRPARIEAPPRLVEHPPQLISAHV